MINYIPGTIWGKSFRLWFLASPENLYEALGILIVLVWSLCTDGCFHLCRCNEVLWKCASVCWQLLGLFRKICGYIANGDWNLLWNKEESIGPPSIYLCGQMRQFVLENESKAWSFGSAQYVKAVVSNVEEYISKKGETLPYWAPTPLLSMYWLEIDISKNLGPQEALYYRSLIGIVHCIVELVRVNICVEVAMVSLHLALPRRGPPWKKLNVFGYLKKHHNAEMVCNPSEPSVSHNDFKRKDWY